MTLWSYSKSCLTWCYFSLTPVANMAPRCIMYPMPTLRCVSMKTACCTYSPANSYNPTAVSFACLLFAINFVERIFYVIVYIALYFAVLSFSCVCMQKHWYLLYTSIPWRHISISRVTTISAVRHHGCYRNEAEVIVLYGR